MGSGSSTTLNVATARIARLELTKPLDASDIASPEEAIAEVVRLRKAPEKITLPSCSALTLVLSRLPPPPQPFLPQPSASMSSSPPFWNYHSSTLISFTTGYMLQDAFWMLRYSFTPSGFSVSASDTTFLLHHLATTLYMVSSRVRGAGHYSAMVLMWLGEVTNPVHNIYMILEHAVAKYPGERVELAFWYASKAFAVSYGFLRIVVGPVAGIWIAYDLLLTSEGRKRVGLTLGVVWTVLIEEVLRGSFVYALEVAFVAWSQAD